MTVTRDQILDYQTYEETRDAFRQKVLREKDLRRIHVGPYLTFLFENDLTIRYQVQEMMRIEHIVKEKDICHELETYNELLGGPGGIGCTLLIEIDSPEERAEKLTAWLPLPKHLYVKLADGEKIYASYDERQIGEDRVSSVQYIKFDTRGAVPVAVGTDFALLTAETTLSPEQRAALQSDML